MTRSVSSVSSVIDNKKTIKEIELEHALSVQKKIKSISDSFVITVPSQNIQSKKQAVYQYTDRTKVKSSKNDKACNNAILNAMSDKSDKAQALKKSLCSHNLKR